MNTINHQIRLAARPVGAVKASDWSRTEEPVRAAAAGEIAIKVLVLSLDPAMRGWMNESKASYIPPVGLREVMRALGVGRVVASNNPGYAVGDHVTDILGAQEYAVTDGAGLFKVDPRLAPLPVYLGMLGMPVAPTSAATWWTCWASTRPLTTRPRTWPRRWPGIARNALTCSSTTWAATSWTPR